MIARYKHKNMKSISIICRALGKNGFAEISKILVRYRSENNFVVKIIM